MYTTRRLLGAAALVLIATVAAVGAVGALKDGADSTRSATERSTTDLSSRFAAYKVAPEPSADPAKVVWPAFVTEAGPEVKRLYEFQLRNGQLMRYMPCFCGCGGNAGHRSNRDCYVRRVDPDGSVVLDSMAPT